MNNNYVASKLPVDEQFIHQDYFFDELIDATAKLEVYKEKIKDSKLDSSWFMPTLQQKEALASSVLEGTQATLDDVLSYQAQQGDKDKNLNEVLNYDRAALLGYHILAREDFSTKFFCELHNVLLSGNVRKGREDEIGVFRTRQNYIGRNDATHAITFTPPLADQVPHLMNNLIQYINAPTDRYRPLVRTAIIHAQFETIHPFMDGNGRVGRMLIPMYLYAKQQIDMPCFFISEGLERDKLKYYTLLNNTRFRNDWDEWIKFFLSTVTKQCDKNISIITAINKLYEKHTQTACNKAKTARMLNVINELYKSPVTTIPAMAAATGLSAASVGRYLNVLVDEKILYTNAKKRYRFFFYYDLMEILRS